MTGEGGSRLAAIGRAAIAAGIEGYRAHRGPRRSLAERLHGALTALPRRVIECLWLAARGWLYLAGGAVLLVVLFPDNPGSRAASALMEQLRRAAVSAIHEVNQAPPSAPAAR